ncbi:MAG: type II secretion system protein [Thermoguttaceae bacterium]
MDAMLRPRDSVLNCTSPHSYLRVSASPRLRVPPSPRLCVSASPRPPAPRGFTLVEMMTVIVIIGILGSLITVAAYRARVAALRAVTKTEISQLQAALESYKAKYGEYPPDFANVNNSNAQQAILRHLRKAFPRYLVYGASNTYVPIASASFANFRYDMLNNPNGAYGIDPLNFDAASGLVFWLGGLPQNTANSYLPAGFNANPAAPFTQGTPRTEPFFNFVADRLGGSATTAGSNATTGPPAGFTDNSGPSGTGGYLRYYPRDRVVGAPYVYFRAQFDSTVYPAGSQYQTWPNNASYAGLCMDFTGTARSTVGIAVPYVQMNPVPVASNTNPYEWRDDDKCLYQIISAGLDENFGNMPADLNNPPTQPRVSRTGLYFSPDNGDSDNQASFADGTLDQEINQ